MSSNNPILLRDILIWARQETLHSRLYFLGVEHLFIALLQIQGGLAQSVLQDQQIPAQSFIKIIRRRAGTGSNQAAWPGVRYTPRTNAILDMANDIALNNGRTEITERDLFSAIVIEKESLPMRLLRDMGVDMDALEQAARTRAPVVEPQLPDVVIDFGPHYDNKEIPDNQLFVLRRMFSTYAKIRIERRLTGFRSALILVITPIHANNQEDAPVVVKVDQTDNILDEAQHYDDHIKKAAVLYTARLEEAPTIPDDSPLGGLKYTLVANDGIIPLDLRNRIHRDGTNQLAQLFEEQLYNRFQRYWWGQSRPYRFHVWQEYDWVLPSLLTLDLQVDEKTPSHMHLLRIPFRRSHLKNTLTKLKPGDTVVLENFAVQKVDRKNQTLKLAYQYGAEAENRAFRVDVRLHNKAGKSFYRGEPVDRLVGTVWKTRDDLLMDAVRALEPPFSPTAKKIVIGRYEFANPLYTYDTVLDYFIRGSASRIHGDLNLSNILVGPENGLWLIDFGHTREGHTLFDWAALEVSLLGDAVMSAAGDSWGSAIKMLRAVMIINKSKRPPKANNANINHALDAIISIRKIVAKCLANPKHWEEYYVALAMCSLRALSWDVTMPLGGRRLMFLVAGVAIQEVSTGEQFAIGDTPSPDVTESIPAVRQLTDLVLEDQKKELPIQQAARPTPVPSSLNTKQLENSESLKVLERMEQNNLPEETIRAEPEQNQPEDSD